MAYEKTTWLTGDVLTATKMNNIEDGVEAASTYDTSLTVSGQAADAKAVGDRFSNTDDKITASEGRLDTLENRYIYYKSPADFGATATDDVGTMIGKMNPHSMVQFWINTDDSYPNVYNWILNGINSSGYYITEAYGIVTIKVTGNCARIRLEPYNNADTYELNYTSINGSGWSNWYRLGNLLTTISYTHSQVSVPALSEIAFSINVTVPYGYRMICVISVVTGAKGVIYEGCNINNSTSTVGIWLYNVTSEVKYSTFACRILCERY